ncbi:transposase [Sphingosinicella rhizophila]|uniref:Transposase n=1 Tax=Sphingosinicella rhizophila TaxID=3050082 RepID=A0ABU3Q9I7_9SPHN|nr:transposase [Sphingosinicella sp. GR2756]MDT9600074.1 transposase [Sphingosinicella sp. GR2756]
MPRTARLVVPGIPHHVTQRGNRCQQTFFGEEDYRLYCDLLAEWAQKSGTAIWAWCLMPNHVHLLLVPADEDGLRATLGETHRRYTRRINQREGWRGHLWQSRFASFAMDEAWLRAGFRYVELNPVRARLVARPEQWRWSSARAHLGLAADGLTDPAPGLARVDDWPAFLAEGLGDEEHDAIRGRERSGWPLGRAKFLDAVAQKTGREVGPKPRGRPRKVASIPVA